MSEDGKEYTCSSPWFYCQLLWTKDVHQYTFPISIDSYLLTEADYTLCLDALAGGSELFLHMSKPPKPGTKAHEILEHLNKVR